MKLNTAKHDYAITLAGNPNVGKSTIFNNLTGMKQHTGNWTGKTVSNAKGNKYYKDKNFLFIDLPGTYSLMAHSEEEEIAREHICFSNTDVTVVVVDATCLERNLNLVFQIFEITRNVIVCVNLIDEAESKGIHIDLEALSSQLNVPVISTNAKKDKTLNKLLNTIYNVCTNNMDISPKVITYEKKAEESIKNISLTLKELNIQNDYLHRWISLKLIDNDVNIINSIAKNLNLYLNNQVLQEAITKAQEKLKSHYIDMNNFRHMVTSSILLRAENISKKSCTYTDIDYNERDSKIDKILTSKIFGIPIMLLFLAFILWITISLANYPSKLLAMFFEFGKYKLYFLLEYLHSPKWVVGLLIDGLYQTLAWVVSVMLPPMAIFFPLFTFFEDLGYLPRIAFNLDNYFKKCHTSR